MFEVLSISIPFFALIFLGYGARRVGFCDADGAALLSRFAFFVALPPLMFTKVAANDPADILNWGFIWRYEMVTIIMFILAAVLARGAFGLSRAEQGIFGLNAAYPNYGYMGIPLSIMAFGDQAALPAGLLLFADTIFLLGLTAFFVSKEGGNVISAVGGIALTMVKNPLLQSVVAGLLFAASGLEMPLVAARLLDLLAYAAPPVALFALGATLHGQKYSGVIGQIGSLTLLKLILHPLLVAGLFVLIPGQGRIWVEVAILSACLPVAANVFMLSHVYGAYTGRTATTIMASTALATFTVPVVLYMLFTWL
ncbi:MAG: AEC family transporter [Candidatus Puniceispirillales bacterium]